MILFSPAKINIGLHILKKREDGFHDIHSLMYLIPFRDIIEINHDNTEKKKFRLTQSGIIVPGGLESNLCYKAWKLYSKEVKKINVHVHLHKRIPMGAGLGGGSSNGASILRGLNNLSGDLLSIKELEELASRLGSDCSLFIKNKPSLTEGRGEILKNTVVDLSGYYIVLINPGIHIDTAWAYSTATPNNARFSLSKMLESPMVQWKNKISNDFEKTVFNSYPVIADIKEALYKSGAVYASMSGSGSTVYGIFEEKPLNLPDKDKVVWQGSL